MESAHLFEQYLRDREFRFVHEPFAIGKNPDYVVTTGDNHEVLCELKDIEQYPQEKRDVRVRDILNQKIRKLSLGYSISIACNGLIDDRDIKAIVNFVKYHKDDVGPEGAKLFFLLPQDYILSSDFVIIDRLENGTVIERYISLTSESNKYPIDYSRRNFLHAKCLLRHNGYTVEVLERDILGSRYKICIEKKDNKYGWVIGPTHAMWIGNHRRVRHSVTKARKQLREHSDLQIPSVVVLYNKSMHNLSDEDVQTAMLGDATFVVQVATDDKPEPKELGTYYGKDGIIQPELNNSISAISVIDKLEKNKIRLRTFHNCWAEVPLHNGIFNGPDDMQFILLLETGKFDRIAK